MTLETHEMMLTNAYDNGNGTLLPIHPLTKAIESAAPAMLLGSVIVIIIFLVFLSLVLFYRSRSIQAFWV